MKTSPMKPGQAAALADLKAKRERAKAAAAPDWQAIAAQHARQRDADA